MDELVRVRVVFDDRKMLTKSQRSEGLKRCWLLLNPGIATISDLESHVRRSFNLKDSCPHGLVLSMDDFVLPPFESTCVLKDKDIIRVRKKDASQFGVIDLGDDPCYIQDSGDMEKQYTVSSDKLLAVCEFGEDSGHKRITDDDLCAHNDNAIDTGAVLKSKKKRKHSDGIQGAKEKKLKISSKMPNITGDEEEDTAEANEGIHLGNSLESSRERGNSRKRLSKKEKQYTSEGIQNISSCLEDSAEQMTGSDKKERRRKKSRLVSPEKAIVTTHEAENIPIEQNQSSCQTRDNPVNRKDKQSDEDGTYGAVIASQTDDNVNKTFSAILIERNVQAEENVGGSTCETHDGSMAKVQSRSARRKKLKRQLVQELKLKEDQNTQSQISPNVIHKESTEQQEADQNTELGREVIPAVIQQEAGQNTELETEIVPVVIRPGHIRFQPIDEEQSQWRSHETMEALHWNGTTSKKKGQKWGREDTVGNWNDANGYRHWPNEKEKNMSKWNDANGYKGQKWDNEKSVRKCNNANSYKGQKFARDMTMSKWNHANGYKEPPYSKQKTVSKWNNANGCREQSNAMASNWNNANDYREQSNNKSLSGKGRTGSNQIDFESLFPLTRIPQVGDVLAYRLIELSSSWCPEVSYFRVGQVASYNYMSLSIILVPVPEYPIFSDEDIERRDSMPQANSSPYNEDGSLHIHYPSLVDVRLLKGSDSEAATSDYPGIEMISTQEEAPVNNWELAVVQTNANSSGTQMSTQETAPVNNWEVAVVNSKAKVTDVQPTANGSAGGSTWDQIKQALNEKKAQLQKKDGWDEWSPSKSTACTSWSYRALRRSAVGPTLAYLRGRNEKHPRGKYNG